MRKNHESGGALVAVLVVLLVLVLLVWTLKALRGGNPQTAVGRVAQDMALTLEEASLEGIRGDADPAVVRKQMLKRLEKENNEWTERNIRKNPSLYLDHCEEMLGELKEECKDALFAARLEALRQADAAEEAREAAASSRRFLTAAEEAAKTGAFPVKIGAYEYTGEAFTNAVRKADAAAEREEAEAVAHGVAAERARELETLLKATLEDVEKELNGIALKRTSLGTDTLKKEAKEVKQRIGELMRGVRLAGVEEGNPPAKLPESKEEGLREIFERNRGNKQ